MWRIPAWAEGWTGWAGGEGCGGTFGEYAATIDLMGLDGSI